MSDRIVSSREREEDLAIDTTLRPRRLDVTIGVGCPDVAILGARYRGSINETLREKIRTVCPASISSSTLNELGAEPLIRLRRQAGIDVRQTCKKR